MTFNYRRMGPSSIGLSDPWSGSCAVSAESLALSMSFPTRWDPFFKPTMNLAEVYHYPTQHFDSTAGS